MKIVVAVKTIADEVPSFNKDNNAKEAVKYVLDPFSEVALEQALRLIEQKVAAELIVITVSSNAQGLRAAMALGATKTIQISSATEDCMQISKLLQQAVIEISPDLVLLGKQSADGDNHQIGQRLSQLLQWPLISSADQLLIEQQNVIASGLVDGGRGQYVATLPAVVTADLRLAEPRFASLPNIMKARRLPIEVIESDDSINTNKVSLVSSQRPKLERKGIQLTDATQLAQLLQGNPL